MEFDLSNNNPKITVSEFLLNFADEFNLKILAGAEGIETRWISSSRMQKLGLAIAGFEHVIHDGRIQIVGQSEIAFLKNLESSKRIEAIRNLDLDKICSILITKNLHPPEELLKIADEDKLPIISTSDANSFVMSEVTRCLQELIAQRVTIHGVMMGLYGVGVLILGDSGIGKSECALDLITRGHRLIADDSVLIKKINGGLIGSSPELTNELLEIRGLGILNIRELFGIAAVGRRKKIELVIKFEDLNDGADVERIGIDIREEEMFGVKVKKFDIPVSIGRNLSTLVETAVRMYLNSNSGRNAAEQLFEKHASILARGQ